MKTVLRPLVVIVVIVAAIAGLVLAYLEMRQERDLEATAESPVIAPSRAERGQDGAAVVKLDAKTQTRLGLQTGVPAPGSVVTELTASARVLDGATLAAQWNETRSAQIAVDAARADYDRKRSLFEKGQNASAAAVETAKALLAQQQVLLETAWDRLTATWGQALAQRDDLQASVRSLLQRKAALVRVDLLSTDGLAILPETIRLLRLDGQELATARLLGQAPTTDSGLAGQSLLCLVTTNAASLIAGSTLLALISTGVIERGVVLPHEAVVRHNGMGWAYVQTAEATFTRRAVALEHPHSEGWLVSGDWTKPVIVRGAQSLLSEELKGSIQMKD